MVPTKGLVRKYLQGGPEEIRGSHENFYGVKGGLRKIFGSKRGAMKISSTFPGGAMKIVLQILVLKNSMQPYLSISMF